ncbi:protein argonaute-2-like [Anneissia japonica]|uniref:protein argonaute-2-like n=1 Tax=Anneissia japonica TaxID=1529436 RepID=UPI0014258D67|nr:protein argonaute-2-like [Anneissia japonica]
MPKKGGKRRGRGGGGRGSDGGRGKTTSEEQPTVGKPKSSHDPPPVPSGVSEKRETSPAHPQPIASPPEPSRSQVKQLEEDFPTLSLAATQVQKPASTSPGYPSGARPKEHKQRPEEKVPPAPEPATPPVVSSGPIASRPSTQALTIPKRRGYGTKGRPIDLYSNHFKVKFSNITIFQYDMTTVPEKLPKKKLRDVFEEMQQTNKQVFHVRCIFDSRKCMYSPEELRLPGNQLELNVQVQYEGSKPLNVKVTIKKVSTINLEELNQYLRGTMNFTPYVAFQAMDTIMRYGPAMRFTPVGRSLFCEPRHDQARDFNLGGGLELHKGFFQSMRPSSWKDYKMSVNIDVSNTAFYKPGPVLEFMVEVLGLRRDSVGNPLKDFQRKQFEKVIKGLQIEVRREPSYKRKFRVIGVTERPAERLTFPLTDEKGRTSECVVARYFFDRYNIRLRYSRLPCLHVGDPAKKTYIPIEMCHIVPNQHCRRKLTPMQTSNIYIFKTAIPAPDRLREIQNWTREAAHHTDPNLKAFGISINPNLVKTPGRVLPPPAIKYREERSAQPNEGSWDMRGKKFRNAVNVNVWGIICFENERFCRSDDLDKMHSVLVDVSRKIGMPFEYAAFVKYEYPDTNFVEMFKYYREKYPGLQLLFIVLPGKGNDIYGNIKKAGDSQVGIATQNIQAINAKKASPRTMENICLKINAKLGGINNIISNISPVMRDPVLILGADVTHPSPGDFHRPSIAAVVGSTGKDAFKYNARVKVQAHRQEVIEDLSGMVRELLIKFREASNVPPKKIIMYRDGVSEGQFQQVLDHELIEIRKACMSLSENYKPGITFITVQKRHHTRLFCVNKQDECGRGRNVPAGTIVDKDITHPVNWDFFLCSHAGIQGTSRPAHYYVLWDDNNFTQDQLEEFTNQMCYTYARCTRSTSIPSPAYYAHHAAFRARDILQSDSKDSDSGSAKTGTSSDSTPKITAEELIKMNDVVQIHMNQNSRMYYA